MFLLPDRHPEFSIQCHSWRHNIQPDADPPVNPSFADILVAGWFAQHRWIRIHYILSHIPRGILGLYRKMVAGWGGSILIFVL